MPLRLMIACLSKHLLGVYKAAHLSSCEKPASMKICSFLPELPWERRRKRRTQRGDDSAAGMQEEGCFTEHVLCASPLPEARHAVESYIDLLFGALLFYYH